MGYLHFEIDFEQTAKNKRGICGDVIFWERTEKSTTIILADGIGHGIKANIAANMTIARLMELLHNGFSIRHAVTSLVKTMEDAIAKDLPYSVFSLVRILPDGITNILTYEMPPPLLVSRRISSILNQRQIVVGKSFFNETNCVLNAGDTILIVSDGITQAGLGRGLKNGLEISGVNHFINDHINQRGNISELPRKLRTEAYRLCEGNDDDDATIAMAVCRTGGTVNIITGPPANKAMDNKVVRKFIESDGIKIVCGATTAKIVAGALGKKLEIDSIKLSSEFTPPASAIDGVDLVTEGALTLNQLFNVLDEDRDDFVEYNPVTELYDYLMEADRIVFLVGRTLNPASLDISFKQMGLLPRNKIVPMIADKLRQKGKLVVMDFM